jgi:hypothetical protein
MSPSKKCTAINALMFAALLLAASMAWAGQVAGTVVRLSGPLMAKKADGSVKALSIKSEVEQGDTLVTQKNTYAQIKFIDNGEITLRPETTFKVESFAYDAGKPEEDSAAFSLVKGGLRSVTGLLGKRNKEKFALKTPGATIGIRGTTFIVQWVEPDDAALAAMQAYNLASVAALDRLAMPAEPLTLAQNTPPPPLPPGPNPASLPAGLYVSVIDGAINLTNKGGSTNFAAGQFGYTANVNKPPVIVPANPGIKFTPPPAFSSTSNAKTGSASSAKAVDCEVR